MNLLRSMLKPFDRRTTENSVTVDRRGSPAKRLNDANDRLNNAVDDLCQTVTMSRSDFNAMIERERISDVLNFDSFSDRCEYRYINGDGKTSLCRNGEHEKICTGLEKCTQDSCPRLRKPE